MTADIIEFPGPGARQEGWWDAMLATMVREGLNPKIAAAAVIDLRGRLEPMAQVKRRYELRKGMTPEQMQAEIQRIVVEAEQPLWIQLAALIYQLHEERAERGA